MTKTRCTRQSSALTATDQNLCAGGLVLQVCMTHAARDTQESLPLTHRPGPVLQATQTAFELKRAPARPGHGEGQELTEEDPAGGKAIAEHRLVLRPPML
jgi:hypothetical protein